MLSWLQGLYWVLPGWIRDPLSVIINGMVRIFTWFDALARAVIPGWARMEAGAVWLATGTLRFGIEVVGTAYWLVYVVVPQAAQFAINISVGWAAAHIIALRDGLWAVIVHNFRWSIDRVTDLFGLLNALRNWASVHIDYLLSAAGHLLKRVFDDWASPGRLAAWLAGAMWSALWGFAWANLDRYSEWFWTRRQAILLRGAQEIERIIARML